MTREQIEQWAREACRKVADSYEMGSLASGLYATFACDVAQQVAAHVTAHQSEHAKPDEFTHEALQTIIDAISSQPPTLMQVAVAVQAFRDEKWRQAIKGRP